MSCLLQEADAGHAGQIASLKEGWAKELKRQRELWLAGEKQRRESWMAQKSKAVKDLTLKARAGAVAALSCCSTTATLSSKRILS